MVPATPSPTDDDGGPLLILRADAGPRIGGGHVVRCTALAEAWRAAGGSAVFGMADPDPGVVHAIRADGFGVVELEDGGPAGLADLVRGRAPAAVAIDHYGIGALDELDGVTDVAPVLLVTDGERRGHLHVAALLDQNVADPRAPYPATCAGPLLLGPRFALLRKAFALARPTAWRAAVENVVVIFGASDPQRLGPPVATGLAERLPGRAVRLVTGALAPPTARAPGVDVVRDPEDLVSVLAAADVVVSAAGSTCWELARLGVPTVCVVVADNQRVVADSVRQLGIGVAVRSTDPARIVDAAVRLVRDEGARAAMASRGPAVVDGRGAGRAVDVLLGLAR